MNIKKTVPALIVSVALLFSACKGCKQRDEALIGTDQAPVKVGFMPAPNADSEPANVKTVVDALSKETGLKIEPILARNYMELIDGLASKKMDVVFINSLGYLLAHDWSKAEALLQLKGEDGRIVYNSAIITNVNSGIKSINEINGKSFAYSDPFSLSGYLMPLAVFAANNVSPVRTTFAGGSSDVVEAVYNGSIDAGAIYYAEREPDGRIHDARLNLVSKHKDMLDKVEIIYISDPIPTTPIVFRAGLNPTIKDKIANAFSKFNADLVVIGALNKLYGATGVLPADDKRYDAIRDMLKKLGKDVTEVVPGAVNFYKTHLWDVVPTY